MTPSHTLTDLALAILRVIVAIGLPLLIVIGIHDLALYCRRRRHARRLDAAARAKGPEGAPYK